MLPFGILALLSFTNEDEAYSVSSKLYEMQNERTEVKLGVCAHSAMQKTF